MVALSRRWMTKVLVSDPIDQAGLDILGQVAQVDERIGRPSGARALEAGARALDLTRIASIIM
mgnify:CR=1 FL=1